MKAGGSKRGLDSFEEARQVAMRLDVLLYIAVVIFLALGARLWWLQVMNHEVYAVQADENRYRILPIMARRGTIYDRQGRVLVSSRSSYNIVLTRPKTTQGFADALELLAPAPPVAPAPAASAAPGAGQSAGQGPEEDCSRSPLGICRSWLAKRFEDAKYEAKWESIVVKEGASPGDAAWVEAHQYEHPELRVEEAPQRHYIHGLLAAHALGYVGEVSQTELKRPGGNFSKEKGYKLGDIIGKSGVERTYNEVLTGRDGHRKVIVDSRGRIQEEVERVEPVAGRDLYTTIDLDIQKVAEAQGDTMPQGRGAIVVADPRNGEVLAMVSRPAFDPNIFSQRAKTPEGKEEISNLYEHEDKPLYNRVIQGAMAPGSTWKLMTSVAALNEGVITPENSKIQDGSIQLGNYFMTSMSNEGFPDVVRAILRSCDGYYYRLGLKLGGERFEKWVHLFKFGEKTGIDLPHEVAGNPPTPTEKARFWAAMKKRRQKEYAEKGIKWTERDENEYNFQARWHDYDMAASAFGQGRNMTTPIQLLRYVGGLAMGGQMYTPHLLLRAAAGMDRKGDMHPELRYEDRNAFSVPMNPEIHRLVKEGMWGAVHAPGGTAGGARVEGFDVSGKTGTAQVASKARAGKNNKDNAWFMSWAPRDNPEISAVVLTENAGFGGTHSAPRAKAIYEDYYRRTRNLPPPTEAEVAKK
jgi:penicillin-binding protein 2